MNKEAIDKINKQIDSILKEEVEDDREVIIDHKYAYDDIDDNTKRIDKIEDLD